MRRFRRRRFRRRRRNVGGFARVSKRFVRRIRRAELRNAETKKLDIFTGTASFTNGDGIQSVVVIQNIPSNLTQGVQSDQFIGNKVFLRGVRIMGQFSCTGAGTANSDVGYLVRYTLVWSRFNAANMTGAGGVYNSTTTALVQPAQVAPLSNPPLFETTGNVSWTGLFNVYPFDRTNVKVIKSVTIRVNFGGSDTAIKKINLWFPINKNFQFGDPLEGDLSTAPNHGKYGSFYLVRQTKGLLSTDLSTTEYGTGEYRTVLYFKDI